MAGDWIKIEMSLHEKPEVIQLAGILGLDRFAVVGRLHRFWSWLDAHSANGHARGVTFMFIDELTMRDGFAAALETVGWLESDGGGLVVPRFDRHNGKSAKNRALATERKRTARNKSRAEGDKGHAPSVTEAGPEKRREEKNSLSTTTTSAHAAPGDVVNDISDSPQASTPVGAEWPTQGDVLKLVGSTAYPLTAECATAYWLDREALGWSRNGQLIKNWRADLQRYATHWMNNERNHKNVNISKANGTNHRQSGRNDSRGTGGGSASATAGAGAGISVPTL